MAQQTTVQHDVPPERPTGGERFVWFSGGFLLSLHLVVALGLGLFALTSDAVDLRRIANRGPEISEVVIATDFAFALEPGDRPSGNLEMSMVNEGATFHNLLIEGQPGFVLEAQPGATSPARLIELADGTYTLFCSVPGHRALGMEADLTIRSDP